MKFNSYMRLTVFRFPMTRYQIKSKFYKNFLNIFGKADVNLENCRNIYFFSILFVVRSLQMVSACIGQVGVRRCPLQLQR